MQRSCPRWPNTSTSTHSDMLLHSPQCLPRLVRCFPDTVVFGVPLATAVLRSDPHKKIPAVLRVSVEFLEATGMPPCPRHLVLLLTRLVYSFEGSTVVSGERQSREDQR